MVLVEPRISGVQANRAIRRTNYPNSHQIEASGFSGGIWLLWKHDIRLSVLHNHKQFMHVMVADSSGGNQYLFTAIYRSPNPTVRQWLWRDLLKLS